MFGVCKGFFLSAVASLSAGNEVHGGLGFIESKTC